MHDLLLDLEDRIAALEQRIAYLESGIAGGTTGTPNHEPIDHRTWVIIAAVVAAMFPRGARLDSVRTVAPRPDRWGIEGRREHFYSHRVR